MIPPRSIPRPLATHGSPREKAIGELRGCLALLDMKANDIRLQRLDLNDLITKLATGSISGMEALNQWQRRKRA